MNCCTLLLLTLLLALTRHEIVAQIGCKKRYMRRLNGKCYYFSVMKLNWFGALNNCLRKGLVLAELSSPLDFYGVVNFLTSMGTQEDFWFAGNDLQTEGRFQYITNARLVRYFSNYSIVDPAEASDCDDCLEIRLRRKLSVVADDNCLERQYFICSERYCDPKQVPKKKLHHSHEHLHHFHHDIEAKDEDDGDDYNDDAFIGNDVGSDSEGPFVYASVEETTITTSKRANSVEATTKAVGIVNTPVIATEVPPWVGSVDVTEQAIEQVKDNIADSGGYKSEGAVGGDTNIDVSERPLTNTRRFNKKFL